MYTHVHVHTHTAKAAAATTTFPHRLSGTELGEHTWRSTVADVSGAKFTLLKSSLHALSRTPPQAWLDFCRVLSYASAHNPQDTILKTDIDALSWSLLWLS